MALLQQSKESKLLSSSEILKNDVGSQERILLGQFLWWKTAIFLPHTTAEDMCRNYDIERIHNSC